MTFSYNRHLLNHLPQQATQENTNSHLLHWHYTQLDSQTYKIHGQTLFYLFILFSVILLITLLLLYARWFFRFRHLHSSSSHFTHTHHSHAPHALHVRAKGLDENVIKAIPIILHQGSSVERDDEMECCICLGVFEDGDKVKVLIECVHRFHSDCVDRWLVNQGSCPLCRVSLRPPPSSDDLKIAQV